MKGILPLFLGIFGTFAFSWAGLTMVPNFQIGHLDPQTDEEGTDAYPVPKSGLADRGRQVYAANGCVYCHSQQVRADYAASDIERKWGDRRSAPRDYIFERPVMLGKMRMGPDLANVGKRAPPEEAEAAAPPASSDSTTVAPAAPGASPAAAAPPTTQPAVPAAAPVGKSDASAPPAAPVAAGSPVVATAPVAAPPAPPPAAPGAPALPPASPPINPQPSTLNSSKGPPTYSAAWHHQHLFAPRSVSPDSNMPSYRFLYEKRRIGGQPSADALPLTGGDADAPPPGWEYVPSYDAKALVAYLMSLDQSHPLKEVKASAPAAAPAPAAGKAAP
jgi:cbb3-type cytochrome oxidase cytochrome c subunit